MTRTANAVTVSLVAIACFLFGRAARSDQPGPAIEPPAAPATEPAVVPRTATAERAPEPPTQAACEARRRELDALGSFAHRLMGPPIQWPPDAPDAVREEGFTAWLEASTAGVAEVIAVDCAAFPCVALVGVEGRRPMELAMALRDELPVGAEPTWRSDVTGIPIKDAQGQQSSWVITVSLTHDGDLNDDAHVAVRKQALVNQHTSFWSAPVLPGDPETLTAVPIPLE